MDESQKPFACNIEGCEMTFTNEDHLNWHQKKHDMVLNLGLANKSAEVADQTPTPTRFIRNCEEVGLFQDLQNVNPFDETFKKAIESGKSGTLHVPEGTSNDDTLHTPHIFPHVENTRSKYLNARNDNQSSDFCITNVTTIADDEYDLTIDLTDESKQVEKNIHDDLKNKLKETIKNKVKTPVVITPVPLERLQFNKNDAPHFEKDDDYVNSKRQRMDKVDDEKEKVREMNRAAQLRCRKRKQVQWKNMEDELRMLRMDNIKLRHENQNFRHKFYTLKELLLNHKCNPSDGSAVLGKIEDLLDPSTLTINKESSPEKVVLKSKNKIVKNKILRKSPSIVPAPIAQNPGQAAQPLFIQVMGPVAQLALSVVQNK